MKFVSIDVEIANPRMSSICQIGMVTFENGRETSAESRYVDPQDYFDPYNMAIHGIDEGRVLGAPSFAALHGWLTSQTQDQIVACHTHFDRTAISQSCTLSGLPLLSCRWLDTARVARRAWPQFSKTGFGLASLANHFDIDFRHHDAVEDARTAGIVLLRAIEDSGHSPEEWLTLSTRKNPPGAGANLRREGDGDGPLVGERVVFTGALQVARRDAADMAHAAGAAVEPNVTKKTTLLIVGDQDIDRLAGHKKSSKHRKAEDLIKAGLPLRILGEADFMHICTAE